MEFQGLTYPSLPFSDHLLDKKLPAATPGGTIATLRSPPASNLGALAALPVELLQQGLLDLDLRTLSAFRSLNRLAADIVDALPEYSSIRRHAPATLLGAQAIGVDAHITLRALLATLRSPECEDCGDFGGYLYLPTCRRVCFPCLDSREQYLPMTPETAKYMCGLDQRTVDALPRMRTVAGVYSSIPEVVPGGMELIDVETARRAGRKLHGGQYEMDELVGERQWMWPGPRGVKYRETLKLHLEGYPVDHAWDLGNPLRFVAVVRVPWLRTLHEADWGFHCVGCKGKDRWPLNRRRMFTAESFKAHLAECGRIVGGEHVSEGQEE
jgi:hypothetical protein